MYAATAPTARARAFAAALTAALAVLPAQAPPAWSTLAVPGGVQAASVSSIGKLNLYRDAATLWVHSACTRRWDALAVNAQATVRIANDCLLVHEGTTWTAYAAFDGRFRALPASPQAQLLNPAANANDSILLVQDGTVLHAFSAFTGAWVSRPVGAGAACSVQRHVALLADGAMLAGMDAFTGQWHDTPALAPPTLLSTDGVVGLAVGPAYVQAFSAAHGTWSAAPALPAATMVRNDDWALFWEPAQMLAYSGIQGRFEYAPLGATAVPIADDLFGVAETALGFVAFSAVRGGFSAPLAPATARWTASVATAVFVDGLAVHGYSALRNTVATAVLDSASEAAASGVACAVENGTGMPHCYSALTGQWYAPPAGVLPQPPLLTLTSVLLPTAAGALAFSARTGAFVPLAAPGLTLLGNDASTVAAAWNATDLFAFDARRDRWLPFARSAAGPPILQLWRTSMFAIDGSTAVGFGAQRGTWEAVGLPEPYVAGRANSESARVVTSNHVLAHSALSELAAHAQFPEFRRVAAAGATTRLAATVGAGGFALVGGGSFAAAAAAFPGLGVLLLDAASLVVAYASPAAGHEHAVLALPVPAHPALVGSEWAFQALVVPGTGQPYLTGAATVLVL